MVAKRGGSRPGAGRKHKWDSDAQRMRAKRFEKRTQAELLVGEAVDRLVDLLDENPAAFDYWVWLRYYSRHPEERPLGVKRHEAKQRLRKHPLSRLNEEALVKAAQMLDLLPWQNPFPYAEAYAGARPAGLVDWEPFVDLLPWAAPKRASGWMAPRRSPEYVDEIGPRIVDGGQVLSYDETPSLLDKNSPDKEEA